jgi:hypothetical protein
MLTPEPRKKSPPWKPKEAVLEQPPASQKLTLESKSSTWLPFLPGADLDSVSSSSLHIESGRIGLLLLGGSKKVEEVESWEKLKLGDLDSSEDVLPSHWIWSLTEQAAMHFTEALFTRSI